jgi:hypothetical protein
MSLDLTPAKALIFRITHIANVPWLLDNGLHCPNSDLRDPSFRRIGNLDLIAKRENRVVPIAPVTSPPPSLLSKCLLDGEAYGSWAWRAAIVESRARGGKPAV